MTILRNLLIPVALAGFVFKVNACGPFFYEAPAPLADYPDRQAIRTWSEIFPEKYPPPLGALKQADLDKQCRELAADFEVTPAFLQRISSLTEANRQGDYRVRYANLLNEMTELVLAKADQTEARAYLNWRLKRINENDGFIHTKPSLDPQSYFVFGEDSKKEAEKEVQLWENQRTGYLSEIDGLMGKSTEVLKPFWEIQRAAWLFTHGEFEEAAKGFDQIVERYPSTGRAEVAELMRARCFLELSRQLNRKNEYGHEPASAEEARKEREKAADLLKRYEKDYPRGRFLADAYGWEGAICRENGDLGGAVAAYLQEMDAKPTREVIRSVMRECDGCFSSSISGEQPLAEMPMEAIATHPAVAMCLVYQCLDPAARETPYEEPYAEDYSGGKEWLGSLNQRLMKPGAAISDALKALGDAIVHHQGDFTAKEWRAFYLAALGWVSLENGNPAQALALTDEGRNVPDPSGDLQMVRGRALERLGNYSEAIKAYQDLGKLDTKGPLAVDLSYRIATCQRQIFQQGFAAVGMKEACMDVEKRTWDPSAIPAFPPLRGNGELSQWADTLTQFAPLDQLEAVAESHGLPADISKNLRTMIRWRALAREDFSLAQKWLDAGVAPDPLREYDDTNTQVLAVSSWMDQSLWNELVAPLITAKEKVKNAKSADERASAMIEMGRLWERVRGKVTSPSLADHGVFENEPQIADERRRHNALLLGLSDQQITGELDRRDEEWHAYQNFFAASKVAENAVIRCEALSAANQSLFRMAQLTPYQADRAYELHWSELSRDIFDRLKKEEPANQSDIVTVFYTFAPWAGRGKWMPGNYTHWLATDQLINVMKGTLNNGGEGYEEEYHERDLAESFITKLGKLAEESSGLSISEIHRQLDTLRNEFLAIYTSPYQSSVLNDFDDLDMFLKMPGVTPEMCAAYFPIRLSKNIPADCPPCLASVGDFIAFIAILNQGNIEDKAADPFQVNAWGDFLKKYPNSLKAEAAMLRLIRGIYRSYRKKVSVEPYYWPEAPIWGGYKKVMVERPNSFDKDAVFGALNEYDRRYPQGRYAAEIRWMRGGASIDSCDYEVALKNLVGSMENPSVKDLQDDAGLDLADCFSRLQDPNQRSAILAALKKNPQGILYLKRFVESNTCGSILRPLEAYFKEAVGDELWNLRQANIIHH